jgi:hypothetical protein
VKVYFQAVSTYGSVEFPDGWPGLPELADLAEAMAETLRRCPYCRSLLARRFLLALAEEASADLAESLRQLAAGWRERNP